MANRPSAGEVVISANPHPTRTCKRATIAARSHRLAGARPVNSFVNQRQVRYEGPITSAESQLVSPNLAWRAAQIVSTCYLRREAQGLACKLNIY